jgi:DNA polymerase-1
MKYLKTDKKILHLIDANNWVNRAFFATPPMNTRDGTGTNAIKAFSNMLWKLLNQIRQSGNKPYMAACFDIRRTDVFRSAVFNEWKARDPELVKALFPATANTAYKGNRDKDEQSKLDMIEQVKICQFLCEIAGIPTFSGKTIGQPVEADDIIGTLSYIKKCIVLIYSRDKDFAQLVSKKVHILQQAQSNSDEIYITSKNVFDKFGVEAYQVIELLMLVGDKVDSIPGVPGCGPGAAGALLKEYDTIKGIQESYEAVIGRYRGPAYAISGQDIPPKTKKDEPKPTIRPDFDVTRKLATIVTDVPGLPTNIKDLALKPPDVEKLKKLKEVLEFNQLLWV